MKIPVLFASFALLAAASAFGSGDFLSRLQFGLESYPEATGNSTHGYLSYRLSEALSSSLLVRITNSAETSTIPDTAKSLYLQNEQVNEVFFYPFSLRLELGDEPLVAGLGGYLSTQSLREVGYFKAAETGLNSYENAQRGTFFGPLLQAGYAWDWSFLQLSLEARLVPYFWFKAAQEITIEPLVTTPGTNSYAGTGFPYVYLRVNPRLFTFLSPEIEYEFQRFTFEALQPAPSTSWNKETNAYDSHTLALRGNIYIPLGGDQYIELGYGQKLKWLLPEGKPALHSAQGIFKLAYRFHK